MFFQKFFKLSEHRTSISIEILAGVTTFLAMSYIIFVNPNILADAQMDRQSVFVATCLAAAVGCFFMAFCANLPVGMAPGMGLNTFFAYTVVSKMGYSWQMALGAVFISGIIFLILSVTGARTWLIKGIPASLRASIVVGIGLFLAVIAFQNAGLMVDHGQTLMTLGNLHAPTVILAVVGFFLVAVLSAWKMRAALLIGILTVTLLSIIIGVNTAFNQASADTVWWQYFVAAPPSLAPTFLQLDIVGALSHGILSIVLVMVLVEVFDATGTLVALMQRVGLPITGTSSRMNRALFADSSAIVAGSLLGTSSTTAYIESSAGVEAGGKTGLTALVVGVLFLLMLFFSPLVGWVEKYATAPALLFVACLMLREIKDIEWKDITESVPASIAAISMPFTFSIAHGIGFGFITYIALKIATLRVREIHPAALLIAVLFMVRYIWIA